MGTDGKIKVLKNAPWYAPFTIKIKEGDPGWAEAYEQWSKGNPPTESLEWKKGIYMGWEDPREDC